MKKRFLASTCVFAICGLASVAHAQDAAPTTAAAPAAQDAAAPSGLADIVVTAQRRSENLQKAAIAVSAVSGSALANAGVTKPTELTALVPALQVAPSAGPYSLFYLRGVGNFNGNALSDSAIAFNFDGVYVGRPSSTTGFFYDLERVEVVKGPQGTLYGRNATGGAVNVITHKPDLGVLGAQGGFEYGNYNAKRADLAINVPLSDNVALRAAGIYVAHDPYMKDGTDNQNDRGGRIALRANPTPDLKILIEADYFQQRGRGPGAVIAGADVNGRYGLQSAEGQAIFSSHFDPLLGRNFPPLTGFQPFLHNNYWGISGTVEYAAPIGTFTLIPAYREGSLNYVTDAPGFSITQREKDKQGSFEGRFASDDTKPLRVLFGTFFYDEKNDVPQYNINQGGSLQNQTYSTHDQSMAVFGRLTYAIQPNIRLSAGARYTTEDKTFSGVFPSYTKVCVVPTGCPAATGFPYGGPVPTGPFFITLPGGVVIPNIGADGTFISPGLIDKTGSNASHASFEKVTYRVGADWDVTSRNLLYVGYETGFKSGGFFFTHDNGTFKPEEIKALTIGSKNRFLDNKLQLNIEGFYYKYKNQQISHLSLDSAGAVIFATENVGKATMRGFEVETQYALTTTTRLNVDLQFNDAKYNTFVFTTPNQNGGTGNGTGCANLGTPGVVYTVNCSGKRPPNAPKWTVNFGAEQTIPLGDGNRLVANARAHYQTKTLTGLEFATIEEQKGYWLADAQLTFFSRGDRFSVGGFINNMFNKTILAGSFPVPFSIASPGPTFVASSLRPPRTFGIRAGFKL